MQQWYKCPRCGASVAFGVRFCGNCGTQLNWSTQQQMQPPPVYKQDTSYKETQVEPKKKTNPWLFGCLIPVGIAVVIGIVALVANSGSHEITPTAPSVTAPPTVPPPTNTPSQTPTPTSPPSITSVNGTLNVYFIDVGQGDSILIDLGQTEVLID